MRTRVGVPRRIDGGCWPGLDSVRSLNDDGPAIGPGVLDPAINERIVRLGNRPGLDKPAQTPTRWTLDSTKLGRVEVLVPVGMTPRDAFRIELAQRGYQVVRG